MSASPSRTSLRAPAATPARGRSTLLLGAVLVLASLNLRAAIASVPPLLKAIQHDLHLSSTAAGILTTLPVICMGLFAPVAQRLAHRIGREATVGSALLVLTLGAATRLGGSQLVLLYGGTLLAGIGIAVAQTVLSGFVKEHFPHRSGLMTGVYSMAMALGATVASALAVPLSSTTGSWQRSLAVWAIPAAVATVAWWPATSADRHSHRMRRATSDPTPTHGLPWRSGTAWLISGYLGLQSWIFYSILSWLAPSFVDRGWTPTRAGYLLSVFNVVGIVGALVLPSMAARSRDRRPWFYLAVGAAAVSLPFLALVPTSAPWLWVGVLGFGAGGAFPLGLLLLVDHAHDPASSARLSAMAFLVAYTLAAIGPVVLGALRDATGNFTAAFLVCSGIAVAEFAMAITFTPGRRARGV